MPNRDIKESCRTSKTLAQLSHGAERLFWRMTTYADDWGRMPADADVLRAACFPRQLERIPIHHVDKWLGELRRVGLIVCYRVPPDGHYLFFVTWRTHQRVRASKSKYPSPTSDGICPHMSADARIRSEDPVVTEDTVTTELRYGQVAGSDRAPDPAETVLAWLNSKAGRAFRPVPTNLDMIRARLREGITTYQLQAVITRKVREWHSDAKMVHYLRPETLFNKTKCEQYIGELPGPELPTNGDPP